MHTLGPAAFIEREVPSIYIYERTRERLRTVCSCGEERMALHQRCTQSWGHRRGLCSAINEALDFQSVMCVIFLHCARLNASITPSVDREEVVLILGFVCSKSRKQNPSINNSLYPTPQLNIGNELVISRTHFRSEDIFSGCCVIIYIAIHPTLTVIH